MPEYQTELKITSRKVLEYKKKRIEGDKYPADFVATVLQSLSLGEDFSVSRVSGVFCTLKKEGLEVTKEKSFRYPLNSVDRAGLLQILDYYHDRGKIKEYGELLDNIISEKKKQYLSRRAGE